MSGRLLFTRVTPGLVEARAAACASLLSGGVAATSAFPLGDDEIVFCCNSMMFTYPAATRSLESRFSEPRIPARKTCRPEALVTPSRMSAAPACPRGKRSAFTLIELLVVIAIIAILAGLGFGAVQGALRSAKRAQARNDVNQVAAAIKSYLLEYGRLPEAGSEIASLLGENPRGIIFFEAKKASGSPAKNGLSGDNALLDPWGNEYEFFLDDDYDNKVNYDGEEYVTTVVVASQGDDYFKISNVKDTSKSE